MRKLISFCSLLFWGGFVTGQVINAFPHNEEFESFTTCATTCGTACVLSNGWVNSATDNMDWTVDVGGTPSLNTGPSVDHNPGNVTGNYLYTETSGAACYNAEAHLISPQVDLTGLAGAEMEFWYHLFGDSTGTLSVDISTNNGVSWATNVWGPVTGNVDLWQMGIVNLVAYAGQTILVRFRGITGNYFTSDMALDDITFRPLVPLDAGILSIDNPGSPITPGLQNVEVTLKNFGTTTLTAANIDWIVNGAPQTQYNWAGSLAPNTTAGPIVLGTYNFLAGTSTVKTWTSAPNGGADQNLTNDTLEISICSGLSGTYSIGPAGDYPSFSAAANAAMSCGVNGPTVFRVMPGTGPYFEQVTIGPILGASPTNTVTFTGGPGRETIGFNGTSTTARHVIKLDGAAHVILDSLSIINDDPAFGFGVHLQNQANYNFIRNCFIQVDTVSTLNDFCPVAISGDEVTTGGNHGDFNEIVNNTLIGGYYGVGLRGTNTTTFSVRNKISGNIIRQTYYYGIYCYYQDFTTISQNKFIMRSTGSTAAYGIYLYYVDRFNVTKNDVKGFGGNGIYCIYGNNQGGAPTSRALIQNNMVGGGVRGTTPYGIYLSTNSRDIDVYHNSVSLDNGNGRSIYITSGSGNNVVNNSFANHTATTGYAMYITSTAYVTTVNNNNYFIPNSTNFIYIGSAYTQATYVGGGGYNTNSIDGDPGYSNNTDNLHASGIQLNNGGAPLGVSDDIDGELRSIPNPDIGADEYIPLTDDVLILDVLSPLGSGRQLTSTALTATNNVTIRVKNIGISPQSNIPVYYRLNGTPVGPELIPGPLNPGDTATFTFAVQANLAGVASYNFDFWTALPGDLNTNNDSLFNHIVKHVANPAISIPYTQGFENAGNDTYQNNVIAINGIDAVDFFHSLPEGRLRTFAGAGYARTGTKAATLDRTPAGAININSLDLVVNMSGYSNTDSILLDFSYMHHGEETHPNDRVWMRGADTLAWIQIYDLFANQGAAGNYNNIVGKNISQILAANGQDFSTSFTLRFGEEDSDPSTSLTASDGYTFDDINLRILAQINTGVIALADPSDPVCGDSNQVVAIVIQNLGVDPLTNIGVTAEITGAVTAMLNGTYPGPLASGQVDTLILGSINSYAGGTININAYTTYVGDNVTGDDTLAFSIDITPIPGAPTTFGDTICAGASAFATVAIQPNTTYSWYDDPIGGNLLFTGDTLWTGPLFAPTNYYVQAGGFEYFTVGAFDNTIGAGANFVNPTVQYMEFDVFQTITLDTVYVYPNAAGNVEVRLMDPTHTTVLQTSGPFAVPGPGRVAVPVGFTINPGSYTLDGGASTTGGLYRNSSGGIYPYTIAPMSITGNSFDPVYYYYFYNWKLHTGSCSSARTEVTIDVDTTTVNAVFNFVQVGPTTYDFTDASTGNVVSWMWDFGDGNTSTQQNPSHTYAIDSTYDVTLVVTGTCSTDTLVQTVVVTGRFEEIPGLGYSVFPNPGSGQFTLDLDLTHPGKISIEITDLIGRKLVEKDLGTVQGVAREIFSIGDQAEGIYLMRIMTENGAATRKLILRK